MKKLLALVPAISLCCLIAAARIPIGTLAGTVVDAHGRPVADAVVMIQTSDGLKPYGAHTNSNGRFEITRLETGQYDLRASFRGSQSDWTLRVMVHPNRTTNVLLRLPAKKAQ
ncbi:MAG TPA: carboxypeptidase-like regulatory domain-containing protein [Candidatus Aquilonibacter sp.]|nr:carboxypeptidase-like regulatory domain-containing protein [Candidatus Aquilonibacter sp.]